MLLDNRIPIRQVHQFRCAKARATTIGYATRPGLPEDHDLLKIRSVKISSLSEMSENSLCKYQVAPDMAMTVGMTMVLPPSHSLKQWERLCQNGSWGNTFDAVIR